MTDVSNPSRRCAGRCFGDARHGRLGAPARRRRRARRPATGRQRVRRGARDVGGAAGREAAPQPPRRRRVHPRLPASTKGSVTAICSGGKAPAAATLERYAARHPAARRRRGVPCPGSSTHGRSSTRAGARCRCADLLAPAVSYARDGFAVSRELALDATLRAGAVHEVRGDGARRCTSTGSRRRWARCCASRSSRTCSTAIARGGPSRLLRRRTRGADRGAACRTRAGA